MKRARQQRSSRSAIDLRNQHYNHIRQQSRVQRDLIWQTFSLLAVLVWGFQPANAMKWQGSASQPIVMTNQIITPVRIESRKQPSEKLKNDTKSRLKKSEKNRPLRKWGFNGCKTVQAIVTHNWPCHPNPVAEPETCKAYKQRQLNDKQCRKGLEVKKDALTLTGRTHGLYFHKKFSGYKKSGPFVELKDKLGNLWWVMKFDWDYANMSDEPVQ